MNRDIVHSIEKTNPKPLKPKYLNPKPLTSNLKPETLNLILNPKAYKPQTLNPKLT